MYEKNSFFFKSLLTGNVALLSENGGLNRGDHSMEEIRYRASIKHTEKTIEALYKMQRSAYEKPRILIRIGAGLVFIAIAAMTSMPMWAKAILLLIGAWLVVSRDFPAQVRADKVVQARKGVLPNMKYAFYGDRLKLSGEGSMEISYSKLARLAEDDDYYYLFVSRDSVCMLAKAELEATDSEAESFRSFMEEQTGMQWRKEKSILNLNLADLILMFRDRKQNK